MRILQVIPSLAWGFGGPTNAVLGLSSALTRQGQEVTIFTTDADVKGKLNVSLETPINIHNVKVFYFPVQRPRHYKFSLPLLKALKKYIPSFDIVHIHSLFQFSTLAAADYCQRYNKPYVIRPLGQLDPFLLKRHFFRKTFYLNLIERKNLEKASAVHFTTEQEKDWCRYLSWEIRSVIVPLGINLEEFKNLPMYGAFRAKYPPLKDKKIVLFLGRINFKKGLDILVKAFASIARERGDLRLVIVGQDNEGYGRKVKNWLKQEQALEKTIFTGMLLGDDKLAAFRDSDIFVLPSYSENFGMTVIEAMACGLPVIISNKVGIYREIQENNAGIVVECNETNLYQGIMSILDNNKLAQDLSSNGRKMVQEYYDINKVADKIVEIYQEILTTGLSKHGRATNVIAKI